MKKWSLALALIFVSLNCLASNLIATRIQPTVMNALKPFSSMKIMGTAIPMIYSGQDVVRRIATAETSFLVSPQTMIA